MFRRIHQGDIGGCAPPFQARIFPLVGTLAFGNLFSTGHGQGRAPAEVL